MKLEKFTSELAGNIEETQTNAQLQHLIWDCLSNRDQIQIELFDFRFHEEKIEFLVPKKWQKALELQKKMN